MAIFPDVAAVRLLPDARSEPRITPRLIIVHTMVGSLRGTEAHFRRRDVVVESHFGIGGPTDGASLDGAIWQWQDTGRQADANYRANAFAVSIETSDGGNPSRPWSPRQLDALDRLIRAVARRHRIPLRQATRWDGSGLGWHVMWGAPSQWTPVAKTCPGPVRIRQFTHTVLPRLRQRPMEDEDVALDQGDKDAIRKIVDQEVNEVYRLIARGEIGGGPSPAHFQDSTRAIRVDTKAILDKLGSLSRPEVDARAVAAALAADEGFVNSIADRVASDLSERIQP
ncbi:MAG TPA: peptidoglycan recognition family protein [Actinomycetes bacterium]|nr:peptidoglycan recognition family protein [Actinomycetes bacterium]